jgi:hypothetical protein
MTTMRLLLACSLLTFTSCAFVGSPTTTTVTDDLFTPTVDSADRLFVVSWPRTIRRYAHDAAGAVTREASVSFPEGNVIFDIDATERANELWVLSRNEGEDTVQRISLRTRPAPGSPYFVRNATVDANEIRIFTDIYDISAGPDDHLYIAGRNVRVVNGNSEVTSIVARCTKLSNGQPFELSAGWDVEADMGTGDVYVLQRRSEGAFPPRTYGYITRFNASLVRTATPLVKVSSLATLAALDGLVVALDGAHTEAVLLRLFVRPENLGNRASEPLQQLDTLVTTEISRNITAGRRISEYCGDFWELNIDVEMNGGPHKTRVNRHLVGNGCD